MDAIFEGGLANEGEGCRLGSFAEAAEHGAAPDGLGGGDGGVGVAHLAPGDGAAFDDHLGFDAEEGGAPDDEVGQLAHFDAAH